MARAFVPVQISTGIFFSFLLFLPTQLGIHFWPDFSSIFGIRVDYLSPTIYLTDLLVFFLILKFFNPSIFKKSFWIWFFQIFLYLLATSLFLAQNQGAALYKLVKIV